MTPEESTPLNNQEWLEIRLQQKGLETAAKIHFNAMIGDEMSDLERITEEYCDSYREGDASWTESLSKDELVELMHQLWPVMRNTNIEMIDRLLLLTEECAPYYRKVAKRLALDRINCGEAYD